MDRFSGSVPRKLIPLRLDVPNTGNPTPRNTSEPSSNPAAGSQQLPSISEVLAPLVSTCPLSGSSNSSNEDVNTFASRMVDTLSAKDMDNLQPGTTIAPLTSTVNTQPLTASHLVSPQIETCQVDSAPSNKSVSGLEDTGSETSDFPNLGKIAQNSVPPTDMSGNESEEVDHLYGVSGPSTVQPRSASSSFPLQVRSLHIDRGHSDEEAEEYRKAVLTEDRELVASARLAVRKYFADNDRFNLPVGHPAVVFSEPQVYHMLRAISDDSVMSSFGLTKNLVLETTGLRPKSPSRHEQRTASFRKKRVSLSSTQYSEDSDGRGELPGSESEPLTPEQNVRDSGGETSAAMHTGDEVDSVPFQREEVPTDQAGFLIRPNDPNRAATPLLSQPSPGGSSHSSEQTLATVLEKFLTTSRGKKALAAVEEEEETEPVTQKQSKPPPPPRSPQKPQVLKRGYSAGMTWTRTFVSGPKDPLNNKYMFYCQLCKRNLSCKSKGAREILRHHKTERHLRLDQRWRYEHLKSRDPVTGDMRHEVRNKYGRVLDPYELDRELPLFINSPLVDIGPKFPFYDDVVGGEGQETSDADNRLKVQLSLIASMLPSSGNFGFLQTLWANVGVYADHQGNYADFDWSKDVLLVSILSFWEYL